MTIVGVYFQRRYKKFFGEQQDLKKKTEDTRSSAERPHEKVLELHSVTDEIVSYVHYEKGPRRASAILVQYIGSA